MDARDISTFPHSYTCEASVKKYFFPNDMRDYCEDIASIHSFEVKTCKCIIVGDVAVGKTCLVNRFTCNNFSRNYKATVGVDFDVQKFTILSVPFNLQTWDTAGQEKYRCIASNYYRDTHSVIIAFDMTNVSSLCNVEKWYSQVIKSNRNNNPTVFVVGTKRDLLCDSVVHFIESEAIRIANRIGAEYWSVSAATGFMIEQLFARIAVVSFENIIHHEMDVYRNGDTAIFSDDESSSPEIDHLFDGRSDWNADNSNHRRKCSL